jgi:hypothetical protein
MMRPCEGKCELERQMKINPEKDEKKEYVSVHQIMKVFPLCRFLPVLSYNL